ncbi:FxDxF family PEP-CTERM protein [Massilia sp. SYSU DXS3249]
MKKSLIAAMVLASASFGSAALAQDDIGNSPQALDLVDDTAYFGDSFTEGNNGNSFADRFTFTVDNDIPMNMDAIVASISRSADVGLDITALGVYDDTDTLVATGSSLRTGATDVWTVSGDNLENGDYYIRVNGNLVSDDGASFGGAVMLMPVPEPEAYGMMLGGLGILGFLARRRKAKRD